MKLYIVEARDYGAISAHRSYEKAEAQRKWLHAEERYPYDETVIIVVTLED